MHVDLDLEGYEDVNVDPLSGKVIVTQTDSITIFDGLVVDSKPTVNSGASEKGKLWGDLRAEQNSANAYVTAPATDQRQVNEMVRGLASDLPAGVDLSKAKAWVKGNTDGTSTSSYNIKSITAVSTGRCTIAFGIPFKADDYICSGACVSSDSGTAMTWFVSNNTQYVNKVDIIRIRSLDGGPVATAGEFFFVVFGELENE